MIILAEIEFLLNTHEECKKNNLLTNNDRDFVNFWVIFVIPLPREIEYNDYNNAYYYRLLCS